MFIVVFHYVLPLWLIWKETQRLKAEPVPGIDATPDESNARYFHVVVDGPKDVCYAIIKIT